MRRLVFLCATTASAFISAGCATGTGEWTAYAPARAAAGLADADSIGTTTLVPGVTHVYTEVRQGPWALHITEIDASRCRPVLEARKPAGGLAARALTTQLAAGSMAAVNADFFMLPGGTPVGAHVSRGVPFIGPTDRPIFAVTEQGEWRGGVARLDGHVATRGDTVHLVQINRAAAASSAYRGTTDGVTLFTARADTVRGDTSAAGPRWTLRLIDGDERAGRGVVVRSTPAVTALPLTPGTAALLAHGSAGDWSQRRSVGDTVTWQARVVLPARGDAAEAVVVEAVGGWPELLHDGRDMLGTQVVSPPFGERRHPRTAVGWSADGSRLFFVVVDGRQPPYSDGMSLPELTWLFQRIGAAHAVNLDGGGSSAVVIQGHVANRPSDPTGERAVGNALALTRCEP